MFRIWLVDVGRKWEGMPTRRKRGKSPVECARLGHMAAAEVISHVGPRPEVKLSDLAKERGLAA